MTVPTTIADLSVSEGSNSPLDSDSITATTRPSDYIRAHGAIIRTLAASSTIAAAGTTDLSTVTGTFITLTGAATTITALGTLAAGLYKHVIYNAAHTLTHNGTSLILLGAANRTVAAGDSSLFVSEGSGNWRELSFGDATGYQPLDALLTALAAQTTAANNVQAYSGADTPTLLSTGTASGNIPLVGTSSATDTLAGLVELATSAEAVTGTDTARAVTPEGVTAAIAVHAIGEGQAWQNLTASRALGTPYTNSTGRSIAVAIGVSTAAANGSFSVTVNGTVIVSRAFDYTTGQDFIVPPGHTYLVTNVANTTLSSWSELI